VLAAYDVVQAAVERAYRGEGATLIEAKTYRIVPHSSDDDDRSYRSREEVEEWKHKDPIQRFQKSLLERGLLTEEKIAAFEARARKLVDDAQRDAESAPYPSEESAFHGVYADDPDCAERGA
jgi:2-oxoisovalerate dehydrogenase E1 component alpha subunit